MVSYRVCLLVDTILFIFGGDGSNHYRICTTGGKLAFVLVIVGWKEPLLYSKCFPLYQNPNILHSQPFAAAYIHGDEAGS